MYFFTFDRQLQTLSHYYIIIIITIASVTSSTDMCIIKLYLYYIYVCNATQKTTLAKSKYRLAVGRI